MIIRICISINMYYREDDNYIRLNIGNVRIFIRVYIESNGN